MIRWLLSLFHREHYVYDLTGATDGYCQHWGGVTPVHYEPTEVRGKYT